MTEPPKTAPPPPTQAAVVNVDVSFREVTAMFELHGRRRLVEVKGDPRLIYDLARFDPLVISGPRYSSDANDRRSRVSGGLPGGLQYVEIEGAGNGAMTFSRPHAQPITGKWIYMFASTDAAGNGMTLERELFADQGGVQLVDLVANKGKDNRAASGAKRSSLQVEIRSIAQKQSRWFWFLLAPYPLAWARLVEMVKSGPQLASRCHRLFDELWTDGSDGTTTKPLWELQSELSANKPLSFVMYLVDPLAEAARRATIFNLWVDVWQLEATKLAGDEEYRLAKRFHNLPAQYVDPVWNKLGGYLHQTEKDLRQRLALASATLEDLLWWIGRPRRRVDNVVKIKGKTVMADTWFVGKDTVGISLEQKSDRSKYNAFSELVADYGHPDTADDVVISVASVVSLVKARLDTLPDGQAFMSKIMKVALDGKLPLADGGASMLFESKRKSSTTSAELASLLLERYANAWVATYRSEALPSLIAFAKKRLALELRQRYSHDVARAMASIERRAANKAAKGGIERLARHYHIDADPAKVQGLRLSKSAADRLALGFEAFNLAYSVQALAQEKDPWAAIGLLGSTIDAYSAVTKLYPKLEKVKFELGKRAVTIELAEKLSVLSSAIDVLMAGRDAINATDPTVKTGHVMRTIGAYLTLGGAIFRATPAGAVMTVVGLALQALGSLVAAGDDKLALMMAYSRWADPPKLDGVMGIQLDGKSFGYQGKLEDLGKDIQAQHRALDWLMYGFDPSLRVVASDLPGIPSRLFLKLNPPEGLGPDARWTIQLQIVARDNGSVLKSWEHQASSPIEEHVSLSSNDEWAIVQHQTVRQQQQPSISERWGKVKVRGTLSLDVFGDGKSVVTRKIDKSVDLPF